MKCTPALMVPALVLTAATAQADPVLHDYTQAVFGPNSADITNPFLNYQTGTLSIFEGQAEDGLEHIETLSTSNTLNILGVENRVVQDLEYIDGLLVEIALDWYAQDNEGNVWYFGEDVVNYNYDDVGNLESTDTEGSWIADGIDSFPGILMRDAPLEGDLYFQEWAPGVAFDFAEVQSRTMTVDIDFGTFDNVLTTGEGNLFDEPEGEIVEFKHYALGTGLVQVQEFDDDGNVEFELTLISQETVPEPGSIALLGTATLMVLRRRRA
ncbi:PEP-CTERM sorting domain-containing protein [Phycisphaeraceae bacterium D3-23]